MSTPIPSLAVTNTKLAAAALALGFRFTCDLIQPAKGGQLVTQFMFRGESLRPEHAGVTLADVRAWQSGELERTAPMHPVCVMMRANHNYDRLLDMQHGQPMRLVSVADAQATLYRPGPESPMFQRLQRCTTDDLCLAASLAAVGLPVIAIRDSGGGRHVYDLPLLGYVVRRADGQQRLEDAKALMQRWPTDADPLRLALEETDPLHPVVMGYDVLHCRTRLRRQIQSTTPLLLIGESAQPRQALVSMDASGRVMDRVTEHFKAPRVQW